MKTTLAAAAVAATILAVRALAQLPPAAYAGPLWDRITQPVKCVGHYAVLPAFTGRSDGPAGTYTWWNAETGTCEIGGAKSGPQF